VLPTWRRSSAFVERILPGVSPRALASCDSAAEWKVRASTPGTPSRSSRLRISAAALSVNVTASSSSERNVPEATCQAMRRVIVVVLPEPAPARMQTGPRTASAARRCSGLSPSRISTAPT
jgi:hypothetical protein